MDAVERSRRDYAVGSLGRADLAEHPLRQLERWVADAVAADIDEPNAMTLATVDAEGRPDARVVLLRGIRAEDVVWFTDRSSTKGAQLAATPHAALVLHWQPLERQVRLRGPVVALDDAASDAYFASRPRGSRLSAWASRQSRPVASRAAYEAVVAEVEARFEGVEDVPRPPDWGGYALTPVEVEFWQGRRSRRHDRLRMRPDVAGGWTVERLQP
ncbi:MAG: pyridoxamine 5-phosphate oxidase [Actinomycetota bacterium]